MIPSDWLVWQINFQAKIQADWILQSIQDSTKDNRVPVPYLCACLPITCYIRTIGVVALFPFFSVLCFKLFALCKWFHIMLCEWNKIFVPFFSCVCIFEQPPLFVISTLHCLLHQNICKLTTPLKIAFLSVCPRCCVKAFVSLTPPPPPANYLGSSFVEQAAKLLNKQINFEQTIRRVCTQNIVILLNPLQFYWCWFSDRSTLEYSCVVKKE